MTTNLTKVIGANVRKLRLAAGVTLDAFALVARQYGLPWTSGRVGDLESGRVLPNLETVYAVAAALAQATRQPVTLADLLATDEPVAINDQLTAEPEQLRAAVTGGPVIAKSEHAREPLRKAVGKRKTSDAPQVQFMALIDGPRLHLLMLREADWRLCKQLGISREHGAAVMTELWGHTFSAERDKRAGADANAQRRGQISRQLKVELEKAITDGNH
jgi:transcriptional regulator with XRE-family HTH domain